MIELNVDNTTANADWIKQGEKDTMDYLEVASANEENKKQEKKEDAET